jgi:hypothetical protein
MSGIVVVGVGVDQDTAFLDLEAGVNAFASCVRSTRDLHHLYNGWKSGADQAQRSTNG